MTLLSQIQGTHTLSLSVQTPMASASTDDEFLLARCPFNLTITAVKWTPAAAVTANGTNFTVISVRNRGTAAGTVLPASRSYAATNSVAWTEEDMTLSATASDLNCAAGDKLTFQRIHTASGVVVPAGLVVVQFKIR